MSNTLGWIVLSISHCCTPQGKNVTEDECGALQAMFGDASWELAADEYKGDLVQPEFPERQGACLPQTTPQASKPAQIDPEGPASDQQWARISQSVA